MAGNNKQKYVGAMVRVKVFNANISVILWRSAPIA
jgi:hypothetical protein